MARHLLISILAFALLTACASKEKKKAPKKAPHKAIQLQDETPPVAETEKQEEPPPQQVLPWSYSGPTGPEHWGELDPLYSKCTTGQQQSPIDLKWKKPAKGGELRFNYK